MPVCGGKHSIGCLEVSGKPVISGDALYTDSKVKVGGCKCLVSSIGIECLSQWQDMN